MDRVDLSGADELAHEIAMATLLREIDGGRSAVLPTAEFFPDPWDGTRVAAERALGRVCGLMGVEPDRLEVRWFRSHDTADIVRDT